MSTLGLVTAAYIAASALFILSLGGLAHQETARRGNVLGIVGMLVAIGATALAVQSGGLVWAGAAIAVGGVVGAVLAARVEMTSMPQLVAVLHSFVGAAAVLVGFASYTAPDASMVGAARALHEIELCTGVVVGALTFTGSIVAYGKLQGTLRSKPLLLPARHALNVLLVVACVVLSMRMLQQPPASAVGELCAVAVFAGVLGIHLVMAIGGADMPVVVSMLNSYSGWAAAAAGFMLGNDLLIVTGALVGSSGAILSYVMCKAMSRSFVSVIFGGFGADEGAAPKKIAAPGGPEARELSVADTVEMLLDARSVVVIPGYGMAVAQAQHPLREITELLRKRGAKVRFAIHPVAGRLPGHMNVLLAEARVPYDYVLEMDEINADFDETDVVLVIGANDIVNPGALDDRSSPIFGMPVLHAWEARHVVVFKRGKGAGYAGVENPLFGKQNARMLYGDAKKSVDAILIGARASIDAGVPLTKRADLQAPV